MKTINTGSFAFVATMFVALSATAGIKYWDNPAYRAYDVDCYVQDGLVLNYDGIRNAGADQPHAPAATTWKNLGSGGATYDMVRYSTNGTVGASSTATAAAWNADASRGAWTDKGFAFDKGAIFHEMASFTVPTTYTIQTLVDATAGDQSGIGYIMCDYNAGNWAGCCLGIRTSAGGGTPANSFYLVASQRPYFTAASATAQISYATAIHNNAEGVIFSGTEAPWNATDGSYRSDLAKGPFVRENGISLGGHYPRTDEMFKGTIKNFRFYTKCLSDDDVAWNRFVDEARFFHRRGALPVTNVVVASNIPIVTGDEPTGCYAVDGSHVFSAPATKVVKGRTYTLDGFTVETWDGSAWGAAVQHNGETSYTASDSALVRITWQWTAGDGLVRYDADDYVQYGLVLNYDGIRNAGLGAAHDSAATTWKNLGNGGPAYDMTRYYTNATVNAWTVGTAQGAWTDTGFTFDKYSVFNESEPLLIPTKRTMQVLVDAKASEQGGIGDVVGCYNGTQWAAFSICMRSNNTIANTFYLNAFGAGTAERPAIYNEDAAYGYGTAIVNEKDAVFFDGTAAPWSAAATGGKTGHFTTSKYTPVPLTDSGISLGGRYPSQDQRFTGTIKSFRFYDRCLTDAEVAWNRVVDDWRYSATVTNVVVASTRGDIQGNEPDGVYEVSGSYTFTAPESVTVGKITYAPAGYAIQQWDDAAGCWGAAMEYTGASYAYTTAAGKVRLLWRWKAVSGIRTAADYDVSDYVAGGLTFHLDGIRNAGAAEEHDSNATTWVNIGTDGEARNATVTKTTDLAWTENGYTFDGTRKFLVSNATGLGTASHTVQFLTDAIQNDQQEPSSAHIFFFSGAQASFASSTYGGSFYYRIQGKEADPELRFTFDKANPLGYVNAITDAVEKKAYVFQGDEKPTTAPNVKSYDSISAPSFNELAIGGWGGTANRYMKGTINYFRYYDRVLSDAELAHNREVDEARYFDALTVTNVVVQTKFASIAGEEEVLAEEPGAYKVEGEWTFSATKVKDKEGVLKDVAGYYTEELNADGTWTRKTWHDGASYTYHAETLQGKTIRLTWCTNRKGLLMILR